MKIFVDIDDTICYYNPPLPKNNKKDYSLAKPYIERIVCYKVYERRKAEV